MNLLDGYDCRVGGDEHRIRHQSDCIGNSPGWVSPTPHWDLGEVSPSASKVLLWLQIMVTRPSGTGYWGLGKGTGLFRWPIPTRTSWCASRIFCTPTSTRSPSGADLKGGLSICHRRGVLGHAGLLIRDNARWNCCSGRSIVAHQCVTPAHDLADSDGLWIHQQARRRLHGATCGYRFDDAVGEDLEAREYSGRVERLLRR